MRSGQVPATSIATPPPMEWPSRLNLTDCAQVHAVRTLRQAVARFFFGAALSCQKDLAHARTGLACHTTAHQQQSPRALAEERVGRSDGVRREINRMVRPVPVVGAAVAR